MRLDLTDPYNDIDAILDKNEKDVNQLLKQLDTLNDIEGFADLMDFDDEVDFIPNESDYADLLSIENKEKHSK